MANILICDDDKDIVNALTIYLSDPDYELFTAYNGEQALDIIGNNDIHLVLLDIMMPVMDGITALNKIRALSSVPVIMISAKSEEGDIVLGLDVGADDYITKPFSAIEVKARVRSQLRRYLRLGSAVEDLGRIVIKGLEIDDSSKQVFADGEEISLTPKEYDILKLLMTNPGKVFSPSEIYTEIWKEEPIGAENTVAVHVRHIREKIEIEPSNPRYIKVVFGRGYKMEAGK